MYGLHISESFIYMFSFIVLAAIAFWIWMMIDCAINESSEGNDKMVWMLVIILTGWIGALIYCFVRRPTRIRIVGR